MEAEGTSTPLIYNFNEKTFIAIIATWGQYPNSKRSSILYILEFKYFKLVFNFIIPFN